VLNPSPCRLGALVSDVIRAVEPDARMKGVSIDERLPQPDVQIIADTEKLRIAVLNLLTNAIKYAPSESTVSVEAAIGRGEVAIAVADQGPGIDPSDEDQVFEKYYRSSRLPESLPGLGLGLYIVRQIVELHGGRVTLESVPGLGSTFAIFLPTG
jgi:signal transduction histidine kinase